MKKYDVVTRIEIEGKDKPVWMKIGMSLTVKDDGKITLYDSRTGQNYYAFERETRGQQRQENVEQVKQAVGSDFDMDVPF